MTTEDAGLIATLASQLLPDVPPSFNVIVDLKGSEHPERLVIVSGPLGQWDARTHLWD